METFDTPSPGKVVCFGELLWRMVPRQGDLAQHGELVMSAGGAEANVAVSLATWGLPARYLTRVPENALARAALDCLASHGVGLEDVLVGGDRMGLYFLGGPNGLSTGEVIYDRKYSSFYALEPGMIDWDRVLEGADWFHWSAITPALSARLAEVCKEGLQAARARGLRISTDLNYRNRLWQYGKDPREVMPALVDCCDVVMGNMWAARTMLDVPLQEEPRPEDAGHLHALAEASSRELQRRFPRCSRTAYTFRFSDRPGHNRFHATLFDGEALFCSQTHETFEVRDRIGGGDAFMAGLIYALKQGWDPARVAEFATYASFCKLFVPGDFNTTPLPEVLRGLEAVLKTPHAS